MLLSITQTFSNITSRWRYDSSEAPSELPLINHLSSLPLFDPTSLEQNNVSLPLCLLGCFFFFYKKKTWMSQTVSQLLESFLGCLSACNETDEYVFESGTIPKALEVLCDKKRWFAVHQGSRRGGVQLCSWTNYLFGSSVLNYLHHGLTKCSSLSSEILTKAGPVMQHMGHIWHPVGRGVPLC